MLYLCCTLKFTTMNVDEFFESLGEYESQRDYEIRKLIALTTPKGNRILSKIMFEFKTGTQFPEEN